MLPGSSRAQENNAPPTEAPTGFDNQTNGHLEQGPPFETLNADNVIARRSFNDNRFIFEETEFEHDGLGPVYNAQSCRECHQSVVTGGASQITEQRSGRRNNRGFFESAGGSLIHSRAIDASLVERPAYTDNVTTLRVSTNTLGDGFVESISDATLLAVQKAQPAALRGTAIPVPVLEAKGVTRIGRFGWKSQHASLESFAADAYMNEMGITSPLFPKENTSDGHPTAGYDHVADPEDDGIDIVAFADFMRATKAPARGPITAAVQAGEQLFNAVGCNVCHTPAMVTAPANTAFNGGKFVVSAALGNKIIHPYSDFLLHNIGTGDGIPVVPITEAAPVAAETGDSAYQMRTAPLWGLRTRNRLMHDGLSFTAEDAINRHGGQAAPVRASFNTLDARRKSLLLAFLDSL
ncbi:MAG: di-heme oxidoredictase family protein [Rhodospirillales bacterium]